MSEQPKPRSAEEVVRDAFTNGVPGSADKAGWVALRAAVFKVLDTLDAERARADAAEAARDRWMAHTDIADHEGMEWKDRHDAAQKSCEDWQECAGNLALALKNQFHEESRTDEMRGALAEFDRLASEATKGVEF